MLTEPGVLILITHYTGATERGGEKVQEEVQRKQETGLRRRRWCWSGEKRDSCTAQHIITFGCYETSWDPRKAERRQLARCGGIVTGDHSICRIHNCGRRLLALTRKIPQVAKFQFQEFLGTLVFIVVVFSIGLIAHVYLI
jgi:hypothetical protein